MNTTIDEHAVDSKSDFVAYLIAVTIASLAFTLLLEGRAIISMGGFETATSNSFSTKSFHLLLMTALLFLIGWVCAFFLALLPFIVGIAVAKKFKISHWLYFVCGATLTSVALLPLFDAIPNLGINVQEPEPSLALRYLNGLPYFMLCGAVAGLACWWYLRRPALTVGEVFVGRNE